MIKEGLISDQLFNWSDNARINIYRPLSTTFFIVKEICKIKTQYVKRISNREIQALWESRLSLYERTWAWSQVLSICKLSKSQAPNDLRSFGKQEESGRKLEQLSKSQRDLRRDQQDQSGIIKTQRTIIKREWPCMLLRYQLIYRRWQLWLLT